MVFLSIGEGGLGVAHFTPDALEERRWFGSAMAMWVVLWKMLVVWVADLLIGHGE